MGVHVPQSWDQELSAGFDDLCAHRYTNLPGSAQRGNAVTCDDDGHVGLRWSPGRIDDGHVCEHQCGSVASRFLVNGNCGLERERQEENCCELFLDVASRPNVPQTDECRGASWIRVHRFVWLNFLLLPYSSNRSVLGRVVPVPPRTTRAESLSTH